MRWWGHLPEWLLLAEGLSSCDVKTYRMNCSSLKGFTNLVFGPEEPSSGLPPVLHRSNWKSNFVIFWYHSHYSKASPSIGSRFNWCAIELFQGEVVQLQRVQYCRNLHPSFWSVLQGKRRIWGDNDIQSSSYFVIIITTALGLHPKRGGLL